mgnify:CR=1 FL=1
MQNNIDLSRFIKAQESSYQTALSEIKNGRKLTHWMWYIFPQIQGLGMSSTSIYYAISDLDEARAYLNDTYLGKNLSTICTALLELTSNNPTEVFGRPDDMKLKSCMTLFLLASDENSLFQKVLDKFFDGKQDKRTVKILENMS